MRIACDQSEDLISFRKKSSQNASEQHSRSIIYPQCVRMVDRVISEEWSIATITCIELCQANNGNEDMCIYVKSRLCRHVLDK